MKNSLNFALVLALITFAFPHLDVKAQSAGANENNGISMTLYPVIRAADGNQYLITPTGKQVTVPGLGIAANATQVSVYRDQANHFWYTNLNGQQIAVTPEQLGAVEAQINAQSGGNSMPPQMMPPPQTFYNATPSYAGGYNGIPYGTPIRVEAPGQFSYMTPAGTKQFVAPTPQTSGQFSQWQQQVPYGQQPNFGSMPGAQSMQGGATPGVQSTQGASQTQMQGTAHSQNGESRMERRRDHRAERLDNRAKNQASNASSDQAFADSKMQSGQTLGTGISSRRSARETRRSKREERRADFLQGN
jgi:hypothetical protein